MESALRIRILAAFAIVVLIASTVFNAILVFSIASPESSLLALRVVLFVSFGFSIVAIIGQVYLVTRHVQQLKSPASALSSSAWWIFVYSLAVTVTALGLSGVSLVWSTVLQQQLPVLMLGVSCMTIIGIWFAAWGISLLMQAAVYIILGLWTRRGVKTQSIGRLDLDFGIHIPSMEERRTHGSFPSQDLTLHSPPRTPTSKAPSSTRRSSTTRVGTASSKIKLVKGSSRQGSLDLPAYPAGEAMSIDTAFDSWDTSSVHHEMRDAVHSSPPTRSGLETIPGSRPESPANALEAFLPSSPVTSGSHHVASSETAEAIGWDPVSPLKQHSSSPPQRTPNFSRPTSRPTSSHRMSKVLAPAFEASTTENSLEELIHPLFRESSPQPPPVAVTGSMVTASPVADQPITPRTLSRMRSGATQHWRAMPSIDKYDRPRTAGSIGGTSFNGSTMDPGSPGPSIVDEEELPPIALPGFVLTAGQRSSLVGYGKRKSTKKERPKSQLSAGSRLSQLLM